MRFVVRAGLVSVLLLSLAVVACRGFSLRQQRVTNEAKPTHPKTALLNVDSSVHRHKEKEPAVIGDDPSEPKETITREDIMTTTANRQYKAAVQKLRKQEQEKNEVAAKVDEAEAAQIVAPPPLVPLASRVVPQPPSVALPAAQVAKVPPAPPRPVASLAAASATVSTVAQEAAKASAAAKTASISPGVTRPKGWDQC